MSDAFLLIGPLVILLALVFYRLVGCSFHGSGVPPSHVIAQWTLGEPVTTVSGGIANDEIGVHEGTYVAVATPTQPEPQSSFPTQPLDGVPPGGFRCGDESLIMGTGTSVRFNGAYVKVLSPDPAIQDRLNRADDFSVTAWVAPESPYPPGERTYRAVISSRADNTNSKGFIIYMGPNLDNPADPAYYWQAWVGVGDGNWGSRLIGPVVDFGGPGNVPITFLAVTYEVSTLTLKLYVNPAENGLAAGMLTLASALLPSRGVPLYIGAGKNEVAEQPPPAPGPQYFFRGRIQEVKIWEIALKGGPVPDPEGELPDDLVLTEYARGVMGEA